MINQIDLDALYTLYGFKKADEKNGAKVYIYNEGYFHNVEVVELEPSEKEVQQFCKEYTDIGYSVRHVRYSTLEEAHEKLFNGFFGIPNTNKRLLLEYDNYCELQKKKLGGNAYSYIECRFYEDNEIKSNGLIDLIYERFFQKGAQLTILEAAAGFGKTCTSYEIICKLAKDCNNKAPILAELSKNRIARVFSYVLLFEIDKKFSTLSYELVRSEIQNGRVPLIIDGFDELLSKSTNSHHVSDKNEIEEAQTMLDTIAELFVNNSQAKVLLTSRKSSIFTGEVFDEWVETKLNNCTVTRIQLVEPTVKDWLGYEKADLLEKTGIQLDSIANPILLAILKNESFDNFHLEYKTVEDILDKYFSLLLTRERERQSLPLEVAEQRQIMKSLAAMMVQYDISVEEPLFIKGLLSEIIAKNSEEFRARYNEFGLEENQIRPSEDEFVMKLLHHALLDRVSTNSNNIGFVNDFIFGIFIGDSIITDELSSNEMSAKYIDLAVTSYAVRDSYFRQELFKKLGYALKGLNQEQQLIVDLKLVRKLTQSYKEQYFDSLYFRGDFEFGKEYGFIDCIFSSCTFEECKIPLSAFECCQFYECRFYNITIEHNKENRQLIFIGCVGHNKLAEASFKQTIQSDAERDYWQIVLRQFWKIGYERAELRRTYRTLFKGIPTQEVEHIETAIEELIAQEFLIKRTYCLELNFSKIDEIKLILGR